MAKDGTRRGGKRVGSGRKSSKMPLPIMSNDAVSETNLTPNTSDFEEKTLKKSTFKGHSGSKTGTQGDASAAKSKNKPTKSPEKSVRKTGTVGDDAADSEKMTVETVQKPVKSSGKAKSVKSSRKAGASDGKSELKADDIASGDDIPELEGADMPPIDEYLRQEQKCGKSLIADEIIAKTVEWLREIRCEHIVSRQLLEQYAMSVARWIQTEQLISDTGFLAKHPTTGAAIASPYVKMSQDYMKQVNTTWYQIYQIVQDNVGESLSEASNDPMERLLRMRGG